LARRVLRHNSMPYNMALSVKRKLSTSVGTSPKIPRFGRLWFIMFPKLKLTLIFYNFETLGDLRSSFMIPLQQISEYGFHRHFQIW